MMSMPRCMKRSGSRMCSMLASEPVSRLSTQITRLPRASSSSHRCEPRKPAPPVTRQVDMRGRIPVRTWAHQGAWTARGRADREFHHRAVLIICHMASTEEHLTVAPIVGPDDPRRFTDSGIEISELYTQEDLPQDLDL